jgi:hypothetical protein
VITQVFATHAQVAVAMALGSTHAVYHVDVEMHLHGTRALNIQNTCKYKEMYIFCLLNLKNVHTRLNIYVQRGCNSSISMQQFRSI